jgi:hypothetical protein
VDVVRVPPPEIDGTQVRLSQAVVSRTLAETEAVTALLTDIFADGRPAPDDDQGPAALPGPGGTRGAPDPEGTRGAPDPEGKGTRGAPDPEGVPGLDRAHNGLLRELATRATWSRAEVGVLAASFAVLPSGALDVINEVAIELTGEPVFDGEDELRVNDEVLREMLG